MVACGGCGVRVLERVILRLSKLESIRLSATYTSNAASKIN